MGHDARPPVCAVGRKGCDMNGSVLLVSAALLAQSALAFDAPRLQRITVDGNAGDWGDRGLRVDRLAQHAASGSTVTPAPEGSASLRLGWDDRGLLLVLTLPASRVEDAAGAAPTINLIVRDGAQPLNWWQAMLDLPPLKAGQPASTPAARLVEHRHDQWVDPREARKALAALTRLAIEARWARGAAGYTLEARLPWGNLGRTPKEGDCLGVQLQVWKGGPSLAWFPYGWAEKCTHYAHLVRLARDASRPLTEPDAGETPPRCPNVWQHGGFSVYIPEGLTRVRGVYVTLPGNKHRTLVDEARLGGYSPMVAIAGQRAFVKDVGFALMGADGPGGDAAPVLEALKALAEATKHPELATVPLIADGYSMGAVRTLDLLNRCPERVVAFTSMNFMKADYLPSDAARKVPALLYTGPKDGYGRGYPAAFAANRAKGALWALIVQPEVGHTVGDCPMLLYPFYKDIIRARLVEDANGRVSLRDMDPEAGWLGDAKAFAIAPAKQFKADRASASWLSSPYVASLWRVLNTRPSGRLGSVDILAAIDGRQDTRNVNHGTAK